ncbi:hypothetical protein FGU46_08160 [Methanobacterium sp. CWC-01]|uniref:hypothetical protein n=1 Tax=Methanobacterium aridiramus TaxID=2584467 RepID=UPI002578EC19|nr:hypothetical protein [Methanobacterium sp. CWC-01]WJI10064.1 hypothetical protein FGU46_08160 [Methanobacterium sp. CWC-01]
MNQFLPNKFELEHVFFGSSGVNVLSLEGNELYFRWEPSFQDYEPFREVRIEPLPEEWSLFWLALDEIGFWEWKNLYQPPEDVIVDGHIFNLDIAFNGRELVTSCWCNAPDHIEEFYQALQDLTDLDFQHPGGVD